MLARITHASQMWRKAFFEGGAFNELESYKSTLEFHLSLLEENDPHYRTKKDRLDQINVLTYEILVCNRYKQSIDISWLSLKLEVISPLFP